MTLEKQEASNRKKETRCGLSLFGKIPSTDSVKDAEAEGHVVIPITYVFLAFS